MKDAEPRIIRLSEYRPPTHLIEATRLEFRIDEGTTRVSSRLTVVRNPDDRSDQPSALRLDGQELELESVSVDGRALSGNEYQRDDDALTLFDLPERCDIEIVTHIHPEQNTALEGLYKSGSMYCTQCEAEGFRKITYYLDRPDVLSRFTTVIDADAACYPVLLSNGNLVDDRSKAEGRRQVTWEDPFPKPSYLFALVAGDLAVMTDEFVTCTGRAIDLRIYSEPHNIGKCGYAMDVLKRAMRWDEQRFGREYDLDTFMIVAVEDFNMGAMENKGLNIFNTSCVLATPDTATDPSYQHVEAVVAHEYFHNWSGNRVTCRDWFQLSLKEGFTVYRDAEFSSDMNSRSVKRIDDVVQLRTHQFAEDAGPLAHPIRPDAYMEISNFYTRTVYDKGAEVVRMLATLLGPDRFRLGTDLYFARHDGQAATTEDFVRAMEDANGADLTQFRHWYSQAGTPIVSVTAKYDDGTLVLDLAQRCPDTPGQSDKSPFHIPFAFGLVDSDGRELLGAAGRRNGVDITLDADAQWENPADDGTVILHLQAARSQVTVRGLAQRPGLSLLRGFSAPVRLEVERSDDELAFLVRRDSDGFSRWDAMRTLQGAALDRLREPGNAAVPPQLLGLYEDLTARAVDAEDDGEAKAMLAEMLSLPTEAYLYEQSRVIDVDGLHAARTRLKAALGAQFHGRWRAIHDANAQRDAYRPDGVQIARRSLKNLALSFLTAGAGAAEQQAAEISTLLVKRLESADNLSDRLAALGEIVNFERFDDERRGQLLEAFYQRWHAEKLVIDRWFVVQAAAQRPGALARVEALESHPAFDSRNPNRVRSVYAAFAMQNLVNFHAIDGSGYTFLADRVVALDATNPQLAARLVTPLTRWQRFDERRRGLMTAALERILTREQLSSDVYEMVTKSLL